MSLGCLHSDLYNIIFGDYNATQLAPFAQVCRHTRDYVAKRRRDLFRRNIYEGTYIDSDDVYALQMTSKGGLLCNNYHLMGIVENRARKVFYWMISNTPFKWIFLIRALIEYPLEASVFLSLLKRAQRGKLVMKLWQSLLAYSIIDQDIPGISSYRLDVFIEQTNEVLPIPLKLFHAYVGRGIIKWHHGMLNVLVDSVLKRRMETRFKVGIRIRREIREAVATRIQRDVWESWGHHSSPLEQIKESLLEYGTPSSFC